MVKFSGVKILASAAALVGAASLLTGCATDVPMEAAPDANNPACADVIVRLPDTVAGQDRRTTNAQATGAWGEAAPVQLTCGIEAGGPTTDTCVNVNDVDWVIDESAAPIYRFEAYGRTPGLVVYVDSEIVSGTEVAVDLSAVVKELPQERHCTDISDTWDIPQESAA